MNRYIVDSPIGPIGLQCEDDVIIATCFNPQYESFERMNLPFQIEDKLNAYFNKKEPILNLPIRLIGTPFQRRVWEAIATIPFGHTLSYKQIGDQLGSKAYQAIGQACGKNPIPLIIPCHRVIAHDGSLGGFSGDIEIKKKLLELEGIRFH
jgi:methylated-DNA-[protein]-cysteine S-methyltransferase